MPFQAGLCSTHESSRKFDSTQSKGRRYKSEWFKMFPFLSYDVTNGSVNCHWYCQTVESKLMKGSELKEQAFLTGFRNWTHATVKFKVHAKSAVHRASVDNLRGASALPVSRAMAEALENEQAKNRSVYREVISTLRGLVRCGSAILGHSSDSGKLMMMLEERGETSPESICIRYATEELFVKEACLGLYEVPGSTAAELYNALKDALQRAMYGMDKLRSYCFDGASNMSGRASGVRPRPAKEQPRSLPICPLRQSFTRASPTRRG